MHTTLAVLIGAAFGAVIGSLAFFWIVDQGFYALILPGGLLGLGAGMARNRSKPIAGVCGAAALLAGLLTEWRYSPFVADGSLTYFLMHVHQLKPITLLMIGVGTVIGFYIPYTRADEFDKRRPV